MLIIIIIIIIIILIINQPNENFLEFNSTKHSVILHLAL